MAKNAGATVSASIAFPFAFPSSLQLVEAPHRSSWALDCRHDRVLILQGLELIVWDPIANEEHHLALPSYPDDHDHSHAAVLCAVDGCDHLDCHSGPYNVVFVGTERGAGGGEYVAWASVYSSETGAWSAVTSTTIEFDSYVEMKPSLLIGDTLYFTLSQSGMLKFDLGGRSLSLIYSPGVFGAIPMMAEDGGLEFTAVLEDSIYIWSWQAATQDSTARWVQQWIMELEPMLPSCPESTSREVIGLVEGTHTIFIDSPRAGVFTLDLKSRQVRRVGKGGVYYDILPYRSFYIPVLEPNMA
ncbi:hypothetical protein EJB05_14203, partial [Eragrostis curvula]